MGRKLRSTKQALARTRALAALVRHAHGEPQDPVGLDLSPQEAELLARTADAWSDQEVFDATWRGEALGALLWALEVVPELPAYDRPFDHVGLARFSKLNGAELRPRDEIEPARETARLWHWRARTAVVQEREPTRLSPRWISFDQLVAATAMKGHARGLLPTPLRGDFPAFGKGYRHLSDEQRTLIYSIAAERHYALEWLCRPGRGWDEVETET